MHAWATHVNRVNTDVITMERLGNAGNRVYFETVRGRSFKWRGIPLPLPVDQGLADHDSRIFHNGNDDFLAYVQVEVHIDRIGWKDGRF
jgi:hypothetical protein